MPIFRDPDDALVVLFKLFPFKNDLKSLEAGRPIYDDVEICEIRAPGSRDVKVFPATFFCRWIEVDGGQVEQTYAERFRHQYQQFKRDAVQTKTGTPLADAPFLTDGRRAELRAQNIYTVEQLAGIEGSELKNLGPGGREMKNKATEYIAESQINAPNLKMAAELQALRARNAILEEDLQAKKQAEESEGEFAGMELDQIREYITIHSGQEPIGAKNMNRKTLVRMAMSVRPEKVA